jgi:serine/threonine protein kinase
MEFETGGKKYFFIDLNKYIIIFIIIIGELLSRISTLGSFSERDASILMRSLFQGVKYMHDRGIAHRDLKVFIIYLFIF